VNFKKVLSSGRLNDIGTDTPPAKTAVLNIIMPMIDTFDFEFD
jgi:hypothetical protein